MYMCCECTCFFLSALCTCVFTEVGQVFRVLAPCLSREFPTATAISSVATATPCLWSSCKQKKERGCKEYSVAGGEEYFHHGSLLHGSFSMNLKRRSAKDGLSLLVIADHTGWAFSLFCFAVRMLMHCGTSYSSAAAVPLASFSFSLPSRRSDHWSTPLSAQRGSSSISLLVWCVGCSVEAVLSEE
jgi:hypothetical protein